MKITKTPVLYDFSTGNINIIVIITQIMLDITKDITTSLKINN